MAAPEDAEVLNNLCEFSGLRREDQFNDYVDGLASVAANVPKEFALTDELVEWSGAPVGVEPLILKQQLRLIRTLMGLVWLVPLGLLLLILLLRVRSLNSLGWWWGIPLLLGGTGTLLLTFAFRPVITRILTARLPNLAPELIPQEGT